MSAPAPADLIDAPPCSRDAPVRGSLAAAAAELERLAVCADDLQHALSPLLRRGGEAVETAQGLDEITQHLHGLAQFLGALAATCPPDWRLDTGEGVARMRLQAQKLRLTFDASTSPVAHPPPSPVAQATGELELW